MVDEENETKEEYEKRVEEMQAPYCTRLHGHNAVIKHIALLINWSDDFTCECGNTSHGSGFHPCNFIGEHVEPYPKLWPLCLYKCDDCGMVYLDVSSEMQHGKR